MIKFDNIVSTKSSYLTGIKVKQIANDATAVITEKGTEVNIKKCTVC